MDGPTYGELEEEIPKPSISTTKKGKNEPTNQRMAHFRELGEKKK